MNQFAYLEEKYPDVDVELLSGGQPYIITFYRWNRIQWVMNRSFPV